MTFQPLFSHLGRVAGGSTLHEDILLGVQVVHLYPGKHMKPENPLGLEFRVQHYAGIIKDGAHLFAIKTHQPKHHDLARVLLLRGKSDLGRYV